MSRTSHYAAICSLSEFAVCIHRYVCRTLTDECRIAPSAHRHVPSVASRCDRSYVGPCRPYLVRTGHHSPGSRPSPPAGRPRGPRRWFRVRCVALDRVVVVVVGLLRLPSCASGRVVDTVTHGNYCTTNAPRPRVGAHQHAGTKLGSGGDVTPMQARRVQCVQS